MKQQKGIGAVVIVVIIALIAIFGGALYYKMNKNSSYTAMQQATTPSQTVMPTPTQSATAATSTLVSTDNSDKGLAQDFANIDAQVAASDKDTANIDSGLNDQMGNLSEQ